MNGTVDARHVLKKAMGVKVDKDLQRGVTSQDVLLFFKEVVRMNAEHGKEVKFKWKREGLNHTVQGKGWSGKHCKKTFSQVGKFVVLGRTKRNNVVHLKRMKMLLDEKVSEEDKETYFASYADGTRKLDHAISITVEDNGKSQLIDNGCKVKPYNLLTLASRMDDVKHCYKMDLYYV
jgi:hypothetical protein